MARVLDRVADLVGRDADRRERALGVVLLGEAEPAHAAGW